MLDTSVPNSKFKAHLFIIILSQWGIRVICYHDFSMDNLPTFQKIIIVRYMLWFLGIGGFQCFTGGTWISIGLPPLLNLIEYGGLYRRNAMENTKDS